MACCGGAKRMLTKGAAIASGYTNLALHHKATNTDARIRACWNCPESTWLTMGEYADWYRRNGIELIKNALDFEKTPPLLKMPQSPGRQNLFCRICKCYVPAKARVKEETCPLNKWPIAGQEGTTK